MISHGDNFKLVTGREAEVTFAAWQASQEAMDRKPRPITILSENQLPERHGLPWTAEEDRRLCDMWKFHGDRELATLFGRNTQGIKIRRHNLGLVNCTWGRPA